MSGCCFAFAPNEGYIYISPTIDKRAGLVSTLEDCLVKEKADKFLWASFGPGRENVVITYRKDDKTGFFYGDDTTPELLEWLNENINNVDEHVKFTLGPDNSFFAWTKSTLRWQNLPAGLEKTIQSWLSPQGWTKGPPRIVSLGANGSYFALSEYGAISYSVPASLDPAYKAITEMNAKDDAGTLNFRDLEVFSLSSCDKENYACVYKDITYKGWIPDPSFDPFFLVLESVMEPAQARAWRLEREKSKKEAEAKKQKAEQERLKQARLARQREAEERRRKQKVEEEAEDLALKYYLWSTAWEDAILRKKAFTTFPHLPISVCTCNEVSCKTDKAQEGSLRACRHDVERFFRASGLYEYAWLKKQRVNWHPDRFGQRCDPDFRKELKKKAEQLYQIFEQLLTQERGTDDDFSPSP